jgi:hypothetical protein
VLCVPYQRYDCGVPPALSNLQRSFTVLRLEINIAARCKKQLRDSNMSFIGRDD